MSTPFHPGLEGVVAAETRLSLVDGEAGQLFIAGLPVEILATHATFEETVQLLWSLTLPAPSELDRFRRELARQRRLPAETVQLLRAAAARRVHPMDALRMGTASLGCDEGTPPREQAVVAVATFPTLVASYWRLRQGEEPVAPDEGLSHAANYLYMLTGRRAEARQTRALDTYLNTVIDHGMNASTFAARVIISTRSDLISAIVGALGALKGPLHGGAPGPALDMVFKIGTIERAEPYIRELLDRGERLMGFGHRVYKVRDPRAEVLSAAARELYSGSSQEDLYALATATEEIAIRLLEERKPGRRLQTNVEYYTALLLHGIGLPTDLFTPTFAVGRVGGWSAHCFEQIEADRLIRPRARYVGERGRPWVPGENR